MLRLSGSMNALMSRISVLWSFPIVLSLHFTSGVHSLRSRSLVQDTMESERHWGVMTAGAISPDLFPVQNSRKRSRKVLYSCLSEWT